MMLSKDVLIGCSPLVTRRCARSAGSGVTYSRRFPVTCHTVRAEILMPLFNFYKWHLKTKLVFVKELVTPRNYDLPER